MRKDGRPLVTEFPVTAMDTIPYIPREQLPPIPPGYGYRRTVDMSWMDEDVQPDAGDVGEWGA